MTKPQILKARIKTVFGAFKNAPKNKKDKTSWNFSIILNFSSTDILLEWMCLINNTLLYSLSTCVTFSLLPLCHQTKLLYIFIKDSVWHIVIYTWKLVMLHIITVNIYIFCDLFFVHDFVCCPPRPEPPPRSVTFTVSVSHPPMQEPHLRSNRAVFSGYTALLPLTGMWYLISFQNLEDGERSGDGLWVAFSHFSSSWAPLKNGRHIGPRLWLFHQHTAPCFFLKWRTDSGNVASWAGLISSSSTRTTCKGGIRIE